MARGGRNRESGQTAALAAKASGRNTPACDSELQGSSGVVGTVVPAVLAAIVGVFLAEVLRRPGAISRSMLGMPFAAFTSGYLHGPVGGHLEQWLWQHGGWPNGYVATHADGSRGFVAAYDLGPGDQVLHVPEHLLLKLPVSWKRRVPVEGESEREAKLLAGAYALGSLASRLDEEVGKMNASKWSPYIQAMMRPSDGSSVPLNSAVWPPEAVSLARLLVPAYMKQVETVLQQDGSAEFRDALRHVLSRFYGGDVAGGDVYLVPMTDFINHVSPAKASTSIRKLGSGGFVVEALVPISAGEEVTVTYGSLPNAHLLAAYGFSLPKNGMGAQVFFVDTAAKLEEGTCASIVRSLVEDGELHLNEALVRVPERGWASCLRQVVVQEGHLDKQGAAFLPLKKACLSRSAALAAGRQDLAQAQAHALHPAVHVLAQLQAVAGDELEALHKCAGLVPA